MELTHARAVKSCALLLILTATAVASRSRAGAQTAPSAVSSDLDALIREGVERNPSVVAARKHWEALKYVPIQMRTLPDPQIQFQEFTVGSPKPSAGYETSDFYYSGLGVSQDIPGFGKLRLRAEIAQQDTEIAQHQYEAAQRSAVEKIREIYFELFYLKKTIALLEREREELARIERIAQTRYRLGDGPAQDVLKAQVKATQMLYGIERQGREMQQRQADLKAALGRSPDTPDVQVGEIDPAKIELDESQVAEAVRKKSPGLMIDRAAEKRSEKAVSLARRDYLPDFTLGYAYQKTGPGLRDYYMLGVGVRVPLYFWRKQAPAIEQAELEAAAARSQVRAQELDSGASAEDQLVAIQASSRILKIYNQGLIPQAENSMQAALAAYRVSKVDFQTLLAAFVDLLNIREEYYREIADQQIAVARLEQIIGELK